MEFLHYKILNQKPCQRKEGLRFVPVDSFGAPATSKGPKLYIVRQAGKTLYVGITRQSITNRLRFGFKAKGLGGYHGYKWKGIKGNLDLLIWYFPKESDHSIEAVEAEVVFAIRHRTGAWPSFQTEIHFHAPTTKERILSKNICKYILR